MPSNDKKEKEEKDKSTRCPKCGGTTTYQTYEPDSNGVTICYLECDECDWLVNIDKTEDT